MTIANRRWRWWELIVVGALTVMLFSAMLREWWTCAESGGVFVRTMFWYACIQ